MDECRYFIGVAAADAVDAAVTGGYVEINHGKAAPLERMRNGDAVLFYSPRASDGGPVLQAFTALARVCGDSLYVGGIAGDVERPFRRTAHYVDVQPASIRPLIGTLEFIHNKANWGAALRYGFLRISAGDFAQVAQAMGGDAATLPDLSRPTGDDHAGSDAARL